MAFDLLSGESSPRDWSCGIDVGLEERRIRVYDEPAPEELLPVPREHLLNPGSNIRVERKALAAFLRMRQAARAAHFPASLFKIVSGFRGNASQEGLWKKALKKYGTPAKARIWVAPPGSSVHATGRALDLWLGANPDSRNAPAMRKTKAYAWLASNADSFGFYPYLPEPWHWEHNPPNEDEAPATPRQEPRREAGPQILSSIVPSTTARRSSSTPTVAPKKGSSVIPVVLGITAAVGIGVAALSRKG